MKKTVIGSLMVVCFAPSVIASVWLDGGMAKMQALDKVTARISTLTVRVGVPRRFGRLEVVVKRCAFHPPEEPPENAAFVTIHDLGYGNSTSPQKVFSGWMFSSSPAISTLEHPVYDINLLACDVN